MKRQILTDKDINIYPNCHAEYFTISDDGELSLKPEYRGATSKGIDYPNSVSDMGAGVVGSLNKELPADLVIPEVVNEMAVDRLSAGMFLDNKAIEALTFPLTIDEIPDYCCSLAVNLRVLKNTEHIKKIGQRAFSSCQLEKVLFPNLEELGGSSVFLYNPYLIYADLGKITNIPTNTFTDAIALTKVKADSVKTVANHSFLVTPKLTNVGFIDSLTSVGDNSFWRSGVEYDWDSLKNCTFGGMATPLQVNPIDFWSDLTPTPCENPLPTQFCQRDERWVNRAYGNRTYKDGCLQISALHVYCGLHNLTFSTVEDFENVIKAVNPDLLNRQNGKFSELKPMLEGIGLTTTRYYGIKNKDELQVLYSHLANGGYAIVELATTISNHGVVIYGINEKKELLCLDSERYYFYDSSKPVKYAFPFHKLIDSNKVDCILVSR